VDEGLATKRFKARQQWYVSLAPLHIVELIIPFVVDVIVSMVLSIQEEEFIADIIYQSSETMNGQRWAAELLSRRKADTASTSSSE
jgi:hypothetical protein